MRARMVGRLTAGKTHFEPVWYATEGRWYLLDDFYERSVYLSDK